MGCDGGGTGPSVRASVLVVDAAVPMMVVRSRERRQLLLRRRETVQVSHS
jgi:hypothetical protein